MKTRNWKAGIVVAGLLLAGPAAAWEEGVIVDFGGQSYEGWSGITAPQPAPATEAAVCWPFTEDGGDCGAHVAARNAARAATAESRPPADARAQNRVAREASPAASAAR
jgi:hypothetical protein